MTQTYEIPEIIRQGGDGVWRLSRVTASEDGGIDLEFEAEIEVSINVKDGQKVGADWRIAKMHLGGPELDKLKQLLAEI